MKWNKLYEYPKSIRSTIKGERHYELGQEKLPSVTTILSATESDEKKEAIKRWKAKVGEKEAEVVKNTAATGVSHSWSRPSRSYRGGRTGQTNGSNNSG